MQAVNWKELIAGLIAAGWTQQRIAAACGVGQSTISDLAAGRAKEPRYRLGAALMQLQHRPSAEARDAA